LALAALLNHANKLVEQVVAIVWTSGSLWVILNRERFDVQALKTFDNLVIQSAVANPDSSKALWGFLLVAIHSNRKPVVVSCYLDATRLRVHHRLVDAAVSKCKLVGFKTKRSTKQLVSKADPKEWHSLAKHLAQHRHLRSAGLRVTWAVREKDRIGLAGKDLLRTYIRGVNLYLKASFGQVLNGGSLDSKVQNRHFADSVSLSRHRV
jgi:hypothetical protein